MRFRTKPAVVEAHRHDGNVASVPDGFRIAVVGTAQDGVLSVQNGDAVNLCRPGDVLVRDSSGAVTIWAAGSFDGMFEPIEADQPVVGPVMATWLPLDLEAPPVLHWGGYAFRQGEPMPVSDAAIIRKLRTNTQFEVSEAADDPTAEPFQPPRRRGRARETYNDE